MHNLIIWVRHLRRIALFEVSARTVLLVLMALGLWVATRHLDFPEQLNINDKVIHVIVFFGFSVLMDLASERRPFWLWKGAPLFLYGVFVEIAQYFSPDREFSLLDMLADFSGILFYFLVKTMLVWVDSRRMRNSA